MKKQLIFVSWAFVFFTFFLFSLILTASAGPYGISVESATYGGNCGAAAGNVTTHIARQCNGRSNCTYTVDHKAIGDPAYGCAKTYVLRYHCGNSGRVYEKRVSAEAGWGDKSVVLDCGGAGFGGVGAGNGGQNISAGGISVESATYGGNCGAAAGNVTPHIARQCNGRSNCTYTVDHKVIGDPAYGCSKTYVLRYRCGNSGRVYEKRVSAEAGWGDKSVVLDCGGAGFGGVGGGSSGQSISAGGITVESATYGGNCGAAAGNVTTHIARQCNGRSNCTYTVDHKVIGDPAYGCSKTYVLRYRCGNSGRVYEKRVSAEAGWGDKSVVLDCGK